MRWTKAIIPTLRDVPKEAEAVSHQLLLKAGFIRKLSSGVYSYLPLGMRVLERIKKIIREEMHKAGSEEILLPALHPAELWKRSGRFDLLGEDKISFKNRSGQEFVLGPTHEEVVTDLMAGLIHSYQDLPRNVYQIQTKFRDELRPRFGIVRTKEFIMKDAYSFHASDNELDATYQKMYAAYERIFQRSGLSFKVVGADTGIMGGSASHEFMVISPYGEDEIAICQTCQTNVSREIAHRAPAVSRNQERGARLAAASFSTPEMKSIADLVSKFKLSAERVIKTMIYAHDGAYSAALVTGDSDVNEVKLRKLLNAKSLRLASEEEIAQVTGAPVGFSGPIKLSIQMVADFDISSDVPYVTGANVKDQHFQNVYMNRDFKPTHIGDIRYIKKGDACPTCKTPYEIQTCMEIGHTFKLGTRYSKALQCEYRNEKGDANSVIMGCYGIGVNRIMAAAVEEHHDSKGIQWPPAIAPFDVEVLTVNHGHQASRDAAEAAESAVEKENLQVLFDDRDERAGIKFNDADLIGAPLQVIFGERNLAKGFVEIKNRQTLKSELIPVDRVTQTIVELLKNFS